MPAPNGDATITEQDGAFGFVVRNRKGTELHSDGGFKSRQAAMDAIADLLRDPPQGRALRNALAGLYVRPPGEDPEHDPYQAAEDADARAEADAVVQAQAVPR